MRVDYWGGPKGMLAPPPPLQNYWGAWPPWPPLFLRLCYRQHCLFKGPVDRCIIGTLRRQSRHCRRRRRDIGCKRVVFRRRDRMDDL